jgi:5-methylcytosine-specific restriction endonuclease McrA
VYATYMASPQWRARSQRTLLLAGGTCQRCGRAPAREAHHLTYDRLGFERDDDLQALCKACHRAAHGR